MSEVLRSTAALLPEVVLTCGLLLIVLIDATLVRARGRLAQVAAALTLAAALVLLLARPAATGPSWRGMVVLDPLGAAFRALILLAALILVLAYTFRNARELRGLGAAEFYALLLGATLSALFLVSANDLTMLYLALETLSIASYVLVAYLKGDRLSNEASLKYLLFGAASTGAMLYGLSLIYGLTGTTSLPGIQEALAAGVAESASNRPTLYIAMVFVFAGFGFKTATVPFHFWCPDAYEGAPTPVTAFLSIVPKAAGFAIITRFFFASLATPLTHAWDLTPNLPWPALLALISAVTMTVGNVAALTQTNMKRLLAYSSIAHAGYILMGLVALSENAARGVLVYLFAYLLMNLGAFLVVLLIHHHEGTFDLRDYPGLLRRAPLLAIAMSFFLLSLVGIPPLVGFAGKLYVFSAVIEKAPTCTWCGWLAVVGAVNAAIAAFYYFRVLKAVVIDSEEEEEAASRPSYTLAWADRTWVVLLAVANFAPLFAWSYVEGWARAALTLSTGR